MRLSELNNYVQTLAAIVAIVGLLLLGYEMRLTNRITISQTASSTWTNWIESAAANIDSGIADALARSMNTPNELTLQDKIDLDFFYWSFIYSYSHDFDVVRVYDNNRVVMQETLEDLTTEAPNVFGSRYARAWFQENKRTMYPEISEAVERGLKGVPLGSGLDYYDRIDARAAAME